MTDIHTAPKNYDAIGRGWIEVICGSMFSGKTEELLRRLRRVEIGKRPLLVFKPAIDSRYHKNNVVSHDHNGFNAIAVAKTADILNHINDDTDVIAIDEAQFFDEEIIGICQQLANGGKRVIIAGLDMDSDGRPFGPIPHLLAIAEYVTKLQAICVQCGNNALHSYRTSNETAQVIVGEKDKYEARCRNCFREGQEKKSTE